MTNLHKGWCRVDDPEITQQIEFLIDDILSFSHDVYRCDIPVLRGLEEKGDYLACAVARFAALDRKRMSFVYDGLKNLPSFHKLYSSTALLSRAEEFLDSNKLLVIKDSVGIRIDLPGEVDQLTDTHQEFHSFPYSVSGLVVWCPLTRVSRQLGTVALWENTHKTVLRFDGNRKRIEELRSAGRFQEAQKQGALRLPDDLGQPLLIEANVGSIFFMTALTLHKSVPTQLDNARVTCQLRAFDYAHDFFSWKSQRYGFNYGLKQPLEAQELVDEWVGGT